MSFTFPKSEPIIAQPQEEKIAFLDFSQIETPTFSKDDFTDINTASGIDIDQKDILAYLNIVFGYSEYHTEDDKRYIAWRSFPEKEDDKNDESKRPVVKFTEFIDGYEKDIITWSKWAADNNYSSYVIPCTTNDKGGKEEHIKETGVIVIDIDNGDINKKIEHLKKYLGLPTLIITSGGFTPDGDKKLHIYYRLNEFTDDLQKVIKARHEIAYKVGADDSFKRITQPIRIAGSIHQKKEPRLVSIEMINNIDYELDNLLVAIEEMPILQGEAIDIKDVSNHTEFTRSMDDVLVNGAKAGADGEETRYATLSRAIGHDIRLCHDGKISQDDLWKLVVSFNQMHISPSWPEVQLKYNVERLWKEHCLKYGNPREFIPISERGDDFRLLRFKEVYNDPTPKPEDLIGDFLLTPRGFLLISGPPKAMKSLLLQDMLQKAALNKKILNIFTPARHLKIMYIQAELSYWALRDRMRAKEFSEEDLDILDENLISSDRFMWTLDSEGIDKLLRTTHGIYDANNKPDIICVDPMRNVMEGDENDNNEVMKFLKCNLEELRRSLNPEAGIILVHHATKTSFEEIAKDPFGKGLRGASCLQGYYSSCIVIARESPKHKERHIWFDFRDGPPPDEMVIEYVGGEFVPFKELAIKVGKEDIKKKMTEVYNIRDILLSGSYENKYYDFKLLKSTLIELGFSNAEKEIDILLKDGTLLLFDGSQCGLPELKGRTYKNMYIWTKGMVIYGTREDIYEDNGAIDAKWQLIRPTHYLRKELGTVDVLQESLIEKYLEGEKY